jgi:hypothetical protein
MDAAPGEAANMDRLTPGEIIFLTGMPQGVSLMLDRDGQPGTALNYARNRRKGLQTLLGIMDGVTADWQLIDAEVAFLDTWLREHKELLTDTDAREVFDFAQHVLNKGGADTVALCDMRGTIQAILENRPEHNDDGQAIDGMNRLIGMVHGVTADRRLMDREILRLQHWIEEAAGGALARNWPGSAILGRITEILADGIVTDEERADLLDMLDSLTGGGFEFGAAGGMATTLPVTPVERINFSGRNFCMTGRFIYGPRARCEAAILQRGGRVLENVTQALDYLVIGGLASRDWVQASYGRKIEKAVTLRNAGRQVFILAEETWAGHLSL